MKTIEINETAIRDHIRSGRLTDYRRHVIEHGHWPGTLSGAELTGKAKEYGASYARSRRLVVEAVYQATDGAVVGRAHTSLHGAILWTHSETGDLVRLSLIGEGRS